MKQKQSEHFCGECCWFYGEDIYGKEIKLDGAEIDSIIPTIRGTQKCATATTSKTRKENSKAWRLIL